MIDQLNNNQGVLALGIFVATMGFGWISWFLSALSKKKKFKLSLTDGPTFCCTFTTGDMYEGNDIHRTGIALYLKVSNIGSSSSSIEKISVAYHWSLKPFSKLWLKNKIGWYWLEDQTVALNDFQVEIGESIKVYPFLTQRNSLISAAPETFLDVGQSTNGVVYFEQEESWGGRFPSNSKGKVKIKVRVIDTNGKAHSDNFIIPAVSLSEAKKYNPSFGATHSTLDGKEPV